MSTTFELGAAWAALDRDPTAAQRIEAQKFRERSLHWFLGFAVEGWHLAGGRLLASMLRAKGPTTARLEREP